jgi:hypothetical protein
VFSLKREGKSFIYMTLNTINYKQCSHHLFVFNLILCAVSHSYSEACQADGSNFLLDMLCFKHLKLHIHKLISLVLY